MSNTKTASELQDSGVMYIASREPFISEAGRSAESLRQHHPDIPIVLYAPSGVNTPSVFDEVLEIDDVQHDFSDSNLTSDRIPFDRTLFLDSDTHVCGSLEPVFDLLDRHELAASQDPTRTGTAAHDHEHDIPEAYPQFNTGVIAFRDTPSVRLLFDRWNYLYHNVDGVAYGLNQPSFRMAAYESDVSIATLPPEFNFRWGMTGNRVGYACGQIRVLHGRSVYWDLDELESELNSTTERRAITVGEQNARVITHEDAADVGPVGQIAEEGYWMFKRDGLPGLARFAGYTILGVIR